MPLEHKIAIVVLKITGFSLIFNAIMHLAGAGDLPRWFVSLSMLLLGLVFLSFKTS